MLNRYSTFLALLLFPVLPLVALYWWWLDSPGEWRTYVPNHSTQSVWLETSMSGFMDNNLWVSVNLRDDPWFAQATDECLGNFQSPTTVSISYSPDFKFEWVTSDSLCIHAQEYSLNKYNTYDRWLVAVVIPSRRKALSQAALAAERLRRIQAADAGKESTQPLWPISKGDAAQFPDIGGSN